MSGFDSENAVDQIAARLAAVRAYGHEQHVSGPRAAERVGLDRACRTIALLVAVVDLHEKAVCGSEADHFDETLSSTACGQIDYAIADKRVAGADKHRRKGLCDGAPGPSEDFRERVPKRRDGEQRRELVLQHMNPTGLKFRTVRLKVGHARNADALEFTLGAQDFHEVLRFRTCIGIPVEMYDIIEIAWARPFRQCSELLRECLGVIVGQDFDAIFRNIAVWMEDLLVDRRENDPLVRGQIKLDAREGVGR